MLVTFDIDGMKMLADIGGFLSGFLMILFMTATVIIIRNPAKYDHHQEDYDQEGKPLPSKRQPVEEPDENPDQTQS